ncbi:MAG TPA: hypothetical protein VMV18_09210, partial [bacterium]|nr:hypothetical protein [bacterium]
MVLSAVSLGMACAAPKVTDLGSSTPREGGNPTPTPGSNGNVTYYKDVLPIVYAQCSSCHTTGGAAFA